MRRWQATITPQAVGYRIDVHNGLVEACVTWWRPTRRWAERTGRRLAGKRQRRDEREASGWTVEP